MLKNRVENIWSKKSDLQLFDTKKIKQLKAKEYKPKKYSILVVDDEVCNRTIIASILKNQFTVLEAGNAAEAIAIVKNHPNPENISIVISDQRMPSMSGVELLTILSVLLPNAKRIIVSGYTNVEAFIESINKANIYKFVLKPFERSNLLSTIESAIENFELKQESDQYLQSLEEILAIRTKELADKNIELKSLRKEKS